MYRRVDPDEDGKGIGGKGPPWRSESMSSSTPIDLEALAQDARRGADIRDRRDVESVLGLDNGD